MFRNSIQSTAFTGNMEDRFFERISGDDFGSDRTFISSLRALIYPRLKEGDSILLRIGSTSVSADEIKELPPKDAIDRITRSYNLGSSSTENQLIVCGLRAPLREDNAACLRLLESEFLKRFRGYERIEKISNFFNRYFGVACFVNRKRRVSIIFVDNMELRKLHHVQSGILAALPWYYDPASGDAASADEQALLKSLCMNTPDQYLLCLQKLAERYDFRGIRIREMVDGFERRMNEQEANSIRREIERIDAAIESRNNEIAHYSKERRQKNLYLAGLLEALNGESHDSEIADYFVCNRRLVLDDVDGSTIHLSVKTDLSSFDPALAQRMIDNKNSNFYMRDFAPRAGISAEDMKLLATAIFVDEKIVVQFCGAYKLDIIEGVRPKKNYEFSPQEFANYMPNTHINKFACMGGHSSAINKCIQSGNYIGALEQCVASCSSLNLGDSAVVNRFLESIIYDVNNGGKRCVRLPDGSLVDFRDALKYLKTESAVPSETAES